LNSAFTEVADGVKAGVRRCLEARQAMNLELLMQHSKTGRDQVVRALECLVASREVEVLRPVGFNPKQALITQDPLEHYRLVRASDRDYTWQCHVQEAMMENERVLEWPEMAVDAGRVYDFGWLLPWRQYAFAAG